MDNIKLLYHMYYSSGSLFLALFHLTIAAAIYFSKRRTNLTKTLAIVFLLFGIKFSMVFACYLIYRKWTLITVPIMLFFAILSIIYLTLFAYNYVEDKSKNKKYLITIEIVILIIAISYFTYSLLSLDIVYNYLVHTYKFYISIQPVTISSSILAFLIGFLGMFLVFFIAPGISTFTISLIVWYFIIFLFISFKKTKSLEKTEKVPLRLSALVLMFGNFIVGAFNFISETRHLARDYYELIFVSSHILIALIVIYFMKKKINLTPITKKIIYSLSIVFLIMHFTSYFYQSKIDQDFDKQYIKKSNHIIAVMKDKKLPLNVKYIALLDENDNKKIKKIIYSEIKNLDFIKSIPGDEKNRNYRSTENINFISFISKEINSKKNYEVGFLYSDYRLFINNKMSLFAYISILLTFISIIFILYYSKKE